MNKTSPHVASTSGTLAVAEEVYALIRRVVSDSAKKKLINI